MLIKAPTRMLLKSVPTITRVLGARSAKTPAPRRLDQSGGAISLWVVLMVPVAAFAAVVAMAGPQRMAAESSLEEAADDLATLAVTLRDGRNNPAGEIEGFLPDCPAPFLINPSPEKIKERDQQLAVCELLLGGDAGSGGYLHRDLGYLGIDTNSWEGFYSHSLVPRSNSPLPDEHRHYGDSLDDRLDSCFISDRLETRNAVYVALAADWENGGWATAQAWPNGVRLGTETVARLNQKRLPWTPERCESTDLSPPPPSDPPRTVFSD